MPLTARLGTNPSWRKLLVRLIRHSSQSLLMPDSTQLQTISARLTPSEWEAVQLMRTRATSDAEMVHVPEAAYRMAEDCTLQLQEMHTQMERISSVMDYFTSQLKTV